MKFQLVLFQLQWKLQASWCEEPRKLVDTIEKTLKVVAGENKSKIYLIQGIRIAVQRENAASIFGTIP